MLERIDGEAFGAANPGFANELVGGEPLESLEPAAEVIGGDEVGEMLAELVMALVVEAPDRCVLDDSVHSFDLSTVAGWVITTIWAFTANRD